MARSWIDPNIKGRWLVEEYEENEIHPPYSDDWIICRVIYPNTPEHNQLLWIHPDSIQSYYELRRPV